MGRSLCGQWTISCLLAMAWVGPAAGATTADVVPSRDNTIYEESNNSNGAGQYLFAGENATGGERRALLHFDVAGAVPAGARILDVSLVLNLSKVAAGTPPYDIALFRLTRDWGEGASDASGEEGGGTTAVAPDATWSHASLGGEAWDTPGGDYVSTASASASVGALGPYEWSSAAMAADVQAWLDAPATNFGWILVNRTSGLSTANRFDSRQHPTAGVRPLLSVTYCPVSACGDGVLDPDCEECDAGAATGATECGCAADCTMPVAGTVCGSSSSTECTAPDTCDGAGSCAANDAMAGTACGDASSTECTAPDSCDGAGACVPNHVMDGVACVGDALFCTGEETCQGGACVSPGDPCLPVGLVCDEPRGLCAIPRDPRASDGCVATSPPVLAALVAAVLLRRRRRVTPR